MFYLGVPGCFIWRSGMFFLTVKPCFLSMCLKKKKMKKKGIIRYYSYFCC